MTNFVSLFDELKNGGYESCVITTFNIDFPFYEEVLLRRMRSAGIFHHILMMDQSMCVQAMNDRPPRMSGYHYSLAPMRSAAAFHPKVLLLLGKHKGLLAVGSHNVTLSGFGQNLEITNVVRYSKSNPSSIPLFVAAYRACLSWYEDYGEGLPKEISESLVRVQELCPWLDLDAIEQPSDFQFLFNSKSTATLWKQLQPKLPKVIDQITAGSAFFDKYIGFVKELSSLGANQFTLGIQSDKVVAPSEIIKLDGIKVVESSNMLNDEGSSQYIHAKFIHFANEEKQIFVSGSANLSAPAWLRSGDSGNAEAIIYRADEEAKDLISELGILKLRQCPPISELTHSIEDFEYKTVDSIALIISSFDEQQNSISIPIHDAWTGQIQAGYYKGSSRLLIEHRVKHGCLLIDCSDVRPGEILTLWIESRIIARVLVHHIHQIKQYSSTGMERKLRQAIGSLGTHTPDLDLLSLCMDRLTTVESSKPKSVQARSIINEAADSSKEAPDSLINRFDDRMHKNNSGRKRLAVDGDIGLIMDFLIRSLSTKEASQSKGQNEDKYGRNEEELIGSDDVGVEEVSGSTVLEENQRISCRNKLERTLSRLSIFLATGNSSESVPAVLSILILVHKLSQHEILKKCVDQELLSRLFSCISKNLLSDRDRFFDDSQDQELQNSEEWGRMLGYITWLAYFAGIKFQSRPPLSTSVEDTKIMNWQSACWLYIAQRVTSDVLVLEEANRLVWESESPGFKLWFDDLVNHAHMSLKGHEFATSLKGFCGYRIVLDVSDKVLLASINVPGKNTEMLASYVELIAKVEN